jgi:hypothetical protein
MVQIEKRHSPPTAYGHGTSPVGFILEGKEEYRVELTPFRPEQTTVRLLDAGGSLLLEEEQPFGEEAKPVVYTVHNLEAGAYYCEITDGFYCQVKEVRLPQR